jgi:hypothetical protein
MAQGYWISQLRVWCLCCRSGAKAKAKFICETCFHVCKAGYNQTPHCPACRVPMRNMGGKWRPAKKGKRSLPEPLPYVAFYTKSPGEALLEKIMDGGKR